MKAYKRLAVVISMVIVCTLAACGSTPSISGTWNNNSDSQEIYTFGDNGSGTKTLAAGITVPITYTIDKDKVTITTTTFGVTDTKEYTYSIKNNELALTVDGNTVTYSKQ